MNATNQLQLYSISEGIFPFSIGGVGDGDRFSPAYQSWDQGYIYVPSFLTCKKWKTFCDDRFRRTIYYLWIDPDRTDKSF